MSKANAVICSFKVDRDIYNTYKSVVYGNSETVKGDLVRYMTGVINYKTPNTDTVDAI